MGEIIGSKALYKGREVQILYAEGIAARIKDGLETLDVTLEELDILPSFKKEMKMKSDAELREMIEDARRKRTMKTERVVRRGVKRSLGEKKERTPRLTGFIPDEVQ